MLVLVIFVRHLIWSRVVFGRELDLLYRGLATDDKWLMITFILFFMIDFFFSRWFVFLDSAMIGLLLLVLIIANGLVEKLLFLEIVFSWMIMLIKTRLLIPRSFELFVVLISPCPVKILSGQHFSRLLKGIDSLVIMILLFGHIIRSLFLSTMGINSILLI